MVLFLIGLGLGDAEDITLKGLNAVRQSSVVYLESYTSMLTASKSDLEALYGKPVVEADREFVESGCAEAIARAKNEDVSILVVGDPFCATTHSDLYLRALEQGVEVRIVHNASIISAVGATGLQVYRFGETVSIPFFTDHWRPYSFYEKVKKNKDMGLHTLALLDIKVKEPNLEELMHGRTVYDPPRFMSVAVACQQLLESEEHLHLGALSVNTKVVAIARMGTATQRILYKSAQELCSLDLGPPLHSLVIPSDLHPMEQDMLSKFS